jgi:hypothetical protein
LTGQKGDGKAAGLDALRLTVLLLSGATNRLSDSRKAPLQGRTVRDAAPRKAREGELPDQNEKRTHDMTVESFNNILPAGSLITTLETAEEAVTVFFCSS